MENVPVLLIDESNDIYRIRFIKRYQLQRTHGMVYINIYSDKYSMVFYPDTNSEGYVIYHKEDTIESIHSLNKELLDEFKIYMFRNELIRHTIFKEHRKLSRTGVRKEQVYYMSRFSTNYRR